MILKRLFCKHKKTKPVIVYINKNGFVKVDLICERCRKRFTVEMTEAEYIMRYF